MSGASVHGAPFLLFILLIGFSLALIVAVTSQRSRGTHWSGRARSSSREQVPGS